MVVKKRNSKVRSSVLMWVVTLIFYWNVFPYLSSSPAPNSSDSKPSSSEPTAETDYKPTSETESATEKFIVPMLSLGRHNRRLEKEMMTEVCCKSKKEAGTHPSYVTLCQNLVHQYNLNVKLPVLSSSYTIFHCSCLSGSPELVSSLLSLADIHHNTDNGDSPLYLAVFATKKTQQI